MADPVFRHAALTSPWTTAAIADLDDIFHAYDLFPPMGEEFSDDARLQEIGEKDLHYGEDDYMPGLISGNLKSSESSPGLIHYNHGNEGHTQVEQAPLPAMHRSRSALTLRLHQQSHQHTQQLKQTTTQSEVVGLHGSRSALTLRLHDPKMTGSSQHVSSPPALAQRQSAPLPMLQPLVAHVPPAPTVQPAVVHSSQPAPVPGPAATALQLEPVSTAYNVAPWASNTSSFSGAVLSHPSTSQTVPNPLVGQPKMHLSYSSPALSAMPDSAPRDVASPRSETKNGRSKSASPKERPMKKSQDTKEVRQEIRRERNRHQAKLSRERKKFIIDSFEQSKDLLQRENQKLREALRCHLGDAVASELLDVLMGNQLNGKIALQEHIKPKVLVGCS